MSLLDSNNNNPNAISIANDLKNQARDCFNNMTNIFNGGSELFWKNDFASPSEIAIALGSDAKEIFELHAKLGALLASIKPESIVDGQSKVGQFTMNNDGTVTIL